jgi:hypothetical protein
VISLGIRRRLSYCALCGVGLALFAFWLRRHLNLCQRGHGMVKAQRMMRRPAGLRGFLAFDFWRMLVCACGEWLAREFKLWRNVGQYPEDAS